MTSDRTADTGLRIPEEIPGDIVGAAIAYANAGWHVLPVNRATKHAGSVLGKGWPDKTSRDPDQLAAWFAGTNHGLALHVGKSRAVTFDVDQPGQLPGDLARHLNNDTVPHQSTRENDPGRGHYPYALPDGRVFGNSNGTLGNGWGEVRGKNGIIVVEPSIHAKADQGGRYQWIRRGVLPTLPGELADQLRDASSDSEGSAVSDAEINRWLAAHSTGTEPDGAQAIIDKYLRESAGGSRHNALRDCLLWAAKEINAGLLPAQPVLGGR